MFDYVIVGGGSAGCALAARLSEDPSVQVCLLEAGPADTSALIHCPGGLALLAKNRRFNWAYDTVPQAGLNGRLGYQPRGKVLGGSSSINAMIYARGTASDYNHWAAIGNTGWSFADLLPYFKKSEGNQRAPSDFSQADLHGYEGPLNVQAHTSPSPYGAAFIAAAMQAGHPANSDFNGADQHGVGMYQVTQKMGERYSAAKAYLRPALQRTNLTVICNAQATRIEFGADNRTATGVSYKLDGTLVTASAAREVILCGGAFASPQLLLQSGIGDAAHLNDLGIPVRQHLPGVGCNLQDHIDTTLVIDTPHLKDLMGLSLKGLVRAIKGVLEWRKHRTGIWTTNFAESGGFIKSDPALAEPDLQLHFVHGKLVDHGRGTTFGHGYSCHVCVLRPASRGTVRLSKQQGGGFALQIDPAFLSSAADVDLLIKGFKATRKILAQAPLASLGGKELASSAQAQTDAEIEAYIRRNADTIYHPVGTCKMGLASDSLAVVDHQLKVHGLLSLRVVDASIMPTLIGGNTNAPVMAIAEKAAQMIKQSASSIQTEPS